MLARAAATTPLRKSRRWFTSCHKRGSAACRRPTAKRSSSLRRFAPAPALSAGSAAPVTIAPARFLLLEPSESRQSPACSMPRRTPGPLPAPGPTLSSQRPCAPLLLRAEPGDGPPIACHPPRRSAAAAANRHLVKPACSGGSSTPDRPESPGPAAAPIGMAALGPGACVSRFANAPGLSISPICPRLMKRSPLPI